MAIHGDIPHSLGTSSLLPTLAHRYALTPSALLIRTAEAELLRAAVIRSPALDLCCGDGFFASLIRPEGFEAGCDISQQALAAALRTNSYGSLTCADASQTIPYSDEYFQTVVSNSSLEHIEHLHEALYEIARVLKPGGRLYTTFGSNFAYQWWPCGQTALRKYLNYQPVYHYYPLEKWKRKMNAVGLRIVDYQYYLSKTATQLLMFLDYHFSLVYMTHDRSIFRLFIQNMQRLPPSIWSRMWMKLFAGIDLLAEGQGGGILLIAEKV